MNRNLEKNEKGFTLIELLLVIALLAVVMGVGLPVYQSFQNRNDLNLALHLFASNLRRAEILVRSGGENSSWGVKINQGSIYLFKGDSYLTRDASYDEVTNISSGLEVSGSDEYVFTRPDGEIGSSATTIFSNINDEEKSITVNKKGTVFYE